MNERGSFNKSKTREYDDVCIEDVEETDASSHFLRIQKNQLIDLMQHLEGYTKTVPVFGLNTGRYDINFIKSYLIPYLTNEKESEPSVIKKANDFVSFNLEMFSFCTYELFGWSYYLRLFSKRLQSQ